MLYYKARPRGQYAVSESYFDERNDGPACYSQEDNSELTGGKITRGSSEDNANCWDINGALGDTLKHGLSVLGVANDPLLKPASSAYRGQSFIATVFDRNAFQADPAPSKVARKVLRDTSFALISAGPDGFYGTPDDVSNLK